jgi:hypothetical protein
MKTRFFIAFVLSLSLAISAESVAQHKKRMDAAQELKDDLRDAIDAKSQAKALGIVQKLVKSGEAEQQYWKNAKIDAALALADQNLSASRQIAAAVKAGDYERANGAFSDLEKACRSCHDLHPEKKIAADSKAPHFRGPVSPVPPSPGVPP